jgi:hypothetical protein
LKFQDRRKEARKEKEKSREWLSTRQTSTWCSRLGLPWLLCTMKS